MPIQIFSYCNNCIWDSRKHFRYPVDTETEKEFVIEHYYFLVLHLGICDLAVLIIYLFYTLELYWFEIPLSDHSLPFYGSFLWLRYR